MTGHFGERRNRTIALVTEDFRLYHRLVPFFESHGIPVLVLKPDEPVPTSVRALLGGPPTDARSVPVLPDLEATLLAAYWHLDRKPGAAGYKRITFGVDPGKVIGLAVVADGHRLLVGEALSVPDAVGRIATWAAGMAGDIWEVHVGSGAPTVSRELVQELRAVLPGARVEVVSEEATTPYSAVTGSRHTDAAVHIALRPIP